MWVSIVSFAKSLLPVTDGCTCCCFIVQAVNLSSEYKAGKLLAYQLLCRVTLRRHDVALPMDHLLRFYITVHRGLISDDQVSACSRY